MVGPTMHLEEGMLVTLFAGALILSCLYGLTIGQTMFYYTTYTSDRIWIKVFVAALFLLDTAKMAATTCLIYHYTIQGRSRYGTFPLPASDTGVNVLRWTMVLISQCFYVHSLDALLRSRKKTARLVVVALGLGAVLAGWSSYIGGVVEMYTESHGDSDGLMRILDSGVVQQAVNVAADIYITLAHIVILRGFKSSLIYKTSGLGSMLSSIIIYSATRGILLVVIQLLEMTTFIVDSTNDTYSSSAVMLPQSALYCNSVLAALNVRKHIRRSNLHGPHEFQLE
ncbi:hypothetical protein DAEQUDRAFT_440178 [Daedalea quercina L-15889]|uniref:DUF6534 domain-containing protein n=1 Tax=Daedalea quercina L-15889 TaxID=1314783 RepID=A0A165NBN3_9APHY|nr:hypothetical protein DAEQUDRAFT_440178 [Daedalea quercina L-15889]